MIHPAVILDHEYDVIAVEGSKEAIVNMFKRLLPKGKTSFNAMINSKNTSRAAIEDYFVNFIKENFYFFPQVV